MRIEKIRFYSGPGHRLVAFLTLPDRIRQGDGNRVPGVVLCHGPGGYGMKFLSDNDQLMIPVADWLAAAGYASLRFYYRGVGESEGPLYRLIPMEQVEDTMSAVSYLQSRQEIDPARVGIFGAAIGGSHAAVTAAVDDRVRCIVSVNGMGNWRRWLKSMRDDREWQAFQDLVLHDSISKAESGVSKTVNVQEVILPDPEAREEARRVLKTNPALAGNMVSLDSAVAMMTYRPEDYTARISPRAALWIAAAGDKLVPNWESESMFENAGEPKRLELLNDSHHGLYRNEGFEKVMNLATDWFNEYL